VTDCWEWLGARLRAGYGVKRHNGERWLVHRLSYTLTYGPVPDGLQVLHRCDNPGCFNPEHLEVGSQSKNMRDAYDRRRKVARCTGVTHCKHGHPFSPENTRRAADGSRVCLTCQRQRSRAHYWCNVEQERARKRVMPLRRIG
jgi:hypothetical protein